MLKRPGLIIFVVGLVAGRLRYPVGKFLLHTPAGKMVRNIALAYTSAWGLASVASRLDVAQ